VDAVTVLILPYRLCWECIVLDLSDGDDIFVKVNIIISIDLFWTYIPGDMLLVYLCISCVVAIC